MYRLGYISPIDGMGVYFEPCVSNFPKGWQLFLLYLETRRSNGQFPMSPPRKHSARISGSFSRRCLTTLADLVMSSFKIHFKSVYRVHAFLDSFPRPTSSFRLLLFPSPGPDKRSRGLRTCNALHYLPSPASPGQAIPDPLIRFKRPSPSDIGHFQRHHWRNLCGEVTVSKLGV